MKTRDLEQEPTINVNGGAANMQPPSARTRLKRGADRARYGRDTVRGILGEGLYCNVGVVIEGHAAIIPTAYAVLGEHLYIHGSTANRVLRAALGGADVCVSVTLLDGLVLARSAFHHSVNYRSVVLYGRGREVTDRQEKDSAFAGLIDRLVPGRFADVRSPNAEEFLRTLVVAIPIEEASAKVRSGPPVDDEDDYDLDVWAGHVPLRVLAEPPVTDERSPQGVPQNVNEWYADRSA
jgi:nitroimidazol reductase NimA-like FMN-containing flavoprotein (pyridoxamine 5'-phosphate oxidase superfamily)